jgi:hypothetical protein
VEVRRDGKLLPRIASLESQAIGGISITGSPCSDLGLPAEPRHTGRIPLHLQYRFDVAGIYEVRYTARDDFAGHARATAQSPWTRIEIQAGSPNARDLWLTQLSHHAPDGSAELLRDYLPSILGIPDRRSLNLVSRYLYHPDMLVRRYAMYGLTYWPPVEAEAVIRELVRRRGPSDVAAEFLVRRPELLAGSEWLVERALPNLTSDSPLLVRGAVIAITRTALLENARTPRALRERAEGAMIEALEHVVRVADAQTVTEYAAALGLLHDDRASSALWDLVRRNVARGQALIALTWRHRPADLPGLAELTFHPGAGQSLAYEL